MDRLKGLKPQEQAACLIAERVLDAVATPWDVGGRIGAVDAMLTLPDGSRAAFEVTALAADGAIQTDSLLDKDDNSWPLPGKWWWTIRVGAPRDIPRLRGAYSKIALACEAAGVEDPWQLLRRGYPDPDLQWLVEESASSMAGHATVPAVDGSQVRTAMVVPTGRGGFVAGSLIGLRPALADVFSQSHFPRHFDKLAKTNADERHLFVPIHWSALPFDVFHNLAQSEDLPTEPPPLPAAITHLWLAPDFSRRVLLWGNEGWSSHNPFDN
ncbi:hypothetical protein ACFYT3_24965 [Nocardia amikacinitolerans]|uniref:hypothetical protein n=1 Tax=Nocardia amikacinitolerans TaxID=756689 RepID=UPI000B00F68A|nr:hypothetical protein [Nocardia amikacinitolerans]MCP2321460.1 hypothetical protein [Nocardia amikacinitolerans]